MPWIIFLLYLALAICHAIEAVQHFTPQHGEKAASQEKRPGLNLEQNRKHERDVS